MTTPTPPATLIRMPSEVRLREFVERHIVIFNVGAAPGDVIDQAVVDATTNLRRLLESKRADLDVHALAVRCYDESLKVLGESEYPDIIRRHVGKIEGYITAALGVKEGDND